MEKTPHCEARADIAEVSNVKRPAYSSNIIGF